jgi:acyl-CoA reductase-like NAD-dependent aldehyde dehydrogenase
VQKAAILQGEYWSGEGMRLYGQSLSSGVPQKQSFTIRQPLGVAALIVPANTPLANISWKSFPALICGNSVVLKASEDAPYTSLLFARITKEAGIPDGVFNVIQGNGKDAGTCILEDTRVKIISFTGSTAVGRLIGEVGGCRLARVSLELGGKNPFVVCDDADIDQAVHWASLSAFSNAGQRCASGSRIIVFDSVYDEFAERLVKKANALKLGIGLDCDLGPVVNLRQQKDILKIIKCSSDKDGKILCGGGVPSDPQLSNGYYIEPTIIELKNSNSNINSTEVFGPVATLQRVDDLVGALSLSNASQYGLTAAIHTSNIDRAMWFAKYINSGVCNINLGTYGSEPHMPFGGFGFSGNGTREPGLEALDVYSELKNISYLTRLEFL